MRKKILNISLIYGIVTGVVCFLFFLMLYQGTPNPLGAMRPFIGFNILFIFLAIWIFKKRQGGFLHFYEGFSIGFLTNIIGALTSGILIFLFVKLIDPAPFDNWIKESLNFLTSQKKELSTFLNEESYQKQLASFADAKPYQIILDELAYKQFAVVAIMLIAMALRKQGDRLS